MIGHSDPLGTSITVLIVSENDLELQHSKRFTQMHNHCLHMMDILRGGLYVKRKAGERLFLENVEWKMTKVLAVKLEKR